MYIIRSWRQLSFLSTYKQMLLYIKYSSLSQIPPATKILVSFLIQIKPKHKCLSELFIHMCLLIVPPRLIQPIIPSVS